ncbi:MAG TPA: HTTM domain-containing protein [Polyangiaceae bacterium]|nr:HTTM domain-containing protein [Polyangiaceae bacterium]
MKRWFGRRFDGWVERSSALEGATALACTRVLVALTLLWLTLPLLLSEAGRQTVRYVFCDVAWGGYRELPNSWFVQLLGGARPEVIAGLLGTASLAGLFLLVGLFARPAALVAAVCSHAALTQNPDATGAGDALLAVCLLVLVVGDSSATWSWDARRRTGSFFAPAEVAAWPRLLAIFQLTVMYVATGLQKLVATAWTPLDGFSALYQILQSPHMARYPDWVPTHGWLVGPLALGTAVTLLFELGFWSVLVWPRLRPAFAALGVVLHLGIALTLKVGAFSWLTLSLYPLLFPERLASLGESLGESLAQRFGKRARSGESAP